MLNLENQSYKLFLKVLCLLPILPTHVMTTFLFSVYSLHHVTDFRKGPVIYLTNTDSELWMFCVLGYLGGTAKQLHHSSRGWRVKGWQHGPEALPCTPSLPWVPACTLNFQCAAFWDEKLQLLSLPRSSDCSSLPLALDIHSDWFCTFPKFGHIIIRRTQAVTGVFSLPQWLNQIMKDRCIPVGKGFPAFPK